MLRLTSSSVAVSVGRHTVCNKQYNLNDNCMAVMVLSSFIKVAKFYIIIIMMGLLKMCYSGYC